MGEAIGRDQVASPQLGRVDGQLHGQHVHRALHHRGRLRPPGAAVGGQRCRIGDDAMSLVGDRWDRVDASRHLPREEGQQRRDSRVGSDVGKNPGPEADQVAVASGPQLHLLHLAAPVRHPDQVLGTGLDPLHRPPELSRGSGHDDQLRPGSCLRSEAAAHVADDHTDVAVSHAQRRRHLGAQPEGGLAGRPNCEPPCLGHHQDRLRLHRHRRQPLVHEAALDRHLGGSEDVIIAPGREVVGHIGAVRGEQQSRARLAGSFRIDNDLQRLEVEPDQLRCVRGRFWALGDHQRHRLAHKTHPPVSKRGSREDLRHHLEADAGGKSQVGGGEHSHDARRCRCRCDIHRPNRGVGQSRPDECHVQTAVRLDVVDVAPGAGDEARILAPAYGVTQNRAGSQHLHRPNCLPVRHPVSASTELDRQCSGGSTRLGVLLGALHLDAYERLRTLHPGVVAGRDLVGVPSLDRGLLAVDEPDRDAAGHRVADVVALAAVGLGHGFDALRPAPAGLKCEPADRPSGQVYQLDLCLVGRPRLVG